MGSIPSNIEYSRLVLLITNPPKRCDPVWWTLVNGHCARGIRYVPIISSLQVKSTLLMSWVPVHPRYRRVGFWPWVDAGKPGDGWKNAGFEEGRWGAGSSKSEWQFCIEEFWFADHSILWGEFNTAVAPIHGTEQTEGHLNDSKNPTSAFPFQVVESAFVVVAVVS